MAARGLEVGAGATEINKSKGRGGEWRVVYSVGVSKAVDGIQLAMRSAASSSAELAETRAARGGVCLS